MASTPAVTERTPNTSGIAPQSPWMISPTAEGDFEPGRKRLFAIARNLDPVVLEAVISATAKEVAIRNQLGKTKAETDPYKQALAALNQIKSQNMEHGAIVQDETAASDVGMIVTKLPPPDLAETPTPVPTMSVLSAPPWTIALNEDGKPLDDKQKQALATAFNLAPDALLSRLEATKTKIASLNSDGVPDPARLWERKGYEAGFAVLAYVAGQRGIEIPKAPTQTTTQTAGIERD